jgi:glycosyltransferase involved in cell wall biosynthesis
MTNKISIIIPTHNRSALLRSTLRCVRAQTWADREVIVVDDASTDDTVSVLTNEFPEVKVIRHDAPHGPGRARNAAIAASSGNWLFFWDDDDLMHSGHLEGLLREALAAPSHCLVAGRARGFAIVSGDVVLGPVFCAPAERSDTEMLIELLEPGSDRTITHSSILWPRKLFDTELWDERIAFYEDFDLCGRAILGGMHVVGREVGMFYIRMHSGPRITTDADGRRVLSPAVYRLKFADLLKAHPEHRGCATALRNGLMEQLIDLSGVAVAKEFMPRLEAAFKAWGGERFYLPYPPQHWLKRHIAQAVLDFGGLAALRPLLALGAKQRAADNTYISSFQPATTDADKADAGFILTYR